MANAVTIDAVNVYDGKAGAELPALEAWVMEWCRTIGEKHFRTIERWRGQLKLEGVARSGFRAPALYIACVGSAGRTETRGSMTYPEVRFSAVVVTKGTSSQKSSRYQEAIAKAGIFWRMLHVMEPDASQAWKRADDIQFKNEYSEKLDKEGVSLFHFTWTHRLALGSIDAEQLDDLTTIFGDIYPDKPDLPDDDLLPTQGEVTFTP